MGEIKRITIRWRAKNRDGKIVLINKKKKKVVGNSRKVMHFFFFFFNYPGRGVNVSGTRALTNLTEGLSGVG